MKLLIKHNGPILIDGDFSILSSMTFCNERYTNGAYAYDPTDDEVGMSMIPDDKIIDKDDPDSLSRKIKELEDKISTLEKTGRNSELEAERYRQLEKWSPKCGSLRISKQELRDQIWKQTYFFNWKPKKKEHQ